jgi:anti-sigma regulatory factor (Ser/Thr protein kinase)
LLVLYTDGLVERRDLDLQTAIEQFADRLPAVDEDLEAGCDRVVGQAGPDDDAALLLVRLDESTRPDWVRFTLAADARAAQAARAISRRTLAGWDEPTPLRDAAELAVSELVTNAWRHGTPPLGLRLSRHDDGVVIEVLDADPRSPRVHRAGSDDEGGRGLFLVDAVSRAWGVRFVGAGKVVWCHLARWHQSRERVHP